MKTLTLLFLVIMTTQVACSGSKAKEAPASPEVKKIQDLLQKGSYDDALKLAKDLADKVPPSSDKDHALYLQGYILAYDKSDLQNARPPLRELLKEFPNSRRKHLHKHLAWRSSSSVLVQVAG